MNARHKHAEHSESVEAGKLRLTLRYAGNLLREIELGWGTGAGPDKALSSLGRAMQAALERYVCGQTPDWPILPLDWESLTPYTRRTLEALLENVPQGRTVSYGELAGMAGNPKGARATGRALGANPWPLVVPCHRVVAANGALTGFSSPCGLEMKRYLLDLEAGSRART
ncbi:MAG: methylated-DNA--[protein]-cysteine S-methyltransferase [Desulfovibrio sp.]